jgi:hypothetical protein
MLKSGMRMNYESKKCASISLLINVARRLSCHLFFFRVRLHSISEFIGGLTMKQRKNIVKQIRNKDVPFRPVPSA